MDYTEKLRDLSSQRAALEAEITNTVAACRANGETWEQIGYHLEVTRQAAQKRYGPMMETLSKTQQLTCPLCGTWTVAYPRWDTDGALDDYEAHYHNECGQVDQP